MDFKKPFEKFNENFHILRALLTKLNFKMSAFYYTFKIWLFSKYFITIISIFFVKNRSIFVIFFIQLDNETGFSC